MNKKLTDMTLKELWQLFPIVLSEHKPYWSDWYEDEVKNLKDVLPSDTAYHHVGSTAVRGIMAKPIIDILIETASADKLRQTAKTLQEKGCIVMSATDSRISLNKGYTEKGFDQKVFHFHVRLQGDIDEIFFRDYLNAHKDVAKDYEALKLSIWKKYEHDRDAYTQAKSDFVKKYTNLAKEANKR